MRSSLYAVYVQTTDKQQAESVEALERIIRRDFSDLDFTGLDRGLCWLRERSNLQQDTVVILANDTFLADPEVADFFALDPRTTAASWP